MMLQLERKESRYGSYVMEGKHHVFFLSTRDKDTHTLYLGWSVHNAYAISRSVSEEEFERRFEKLYFDDSNYDWWERTPMSVKGAIEWFEDYIPNADPYEVNVEALEMGLKALKKEEFEGDPDIIVEGSHDGKKWERVALGNFDEDDPNSFFFNNDNSYTYYRVTRRVLDAKQRL